MKEKEEVEVNEKEEEAVCVNIYTRGRSKFRNE